MPNYLAPGVYVEEVSYRTKSIEGVGTTTTAFVGPTRYGPLYDQLTVLTSLSDYEQIYGDGSQLEFDDDGEMDNFMWHGVRAFFFEGGSTLYVKRIVRSDPNTGAPVDAGTATGQIPGITAPITFAARYPGAYGNFHVNITLQISQNVLAMQQGIATVRGVNDHDVVMITVPVGSAPSSLLAELSSPPSLNADLTSPPSLGSPPHESAFTHAGNEFIFASALSALDPTTGNRAWTFTTSTGVALTPAQLVAVSGVTVQMVTVSVSVAQNVAGATTTAWNGLPLDPSHRTNGTPDALGAVFAQVTPAGTPTPIVIDLASNATGLEVLYSLGSALDLALLAPPSTTPTAATASFDLVLEDGTDGSRPVDADYEGMERPDDTKTGLVAFEDIDEIAIVAAPGSTAGLAGNPDQARATINGLIAHAEKMDFRIAVIDPIDDYTLTEVRDLRAQFDSSWAAIYYPWVRIIDPITNLEKNMPPSGFICGVYARSDDNTGVYKAPANEVINLAINFERPINKAQQEILNPEGINCLRFLEGQGYLVWGARTMSSDPEWMYVNVRRYFAYLEHSVDLGTQWAVFEPNGERLWANVTGTLDEFLFNEWRSGALLGAKAEQSYFVRCDRTTMTQDDLDNGRLVCLIGVAPLKPAEFVIFRIGQWTADASM